MELKIDKQLIDEAVQKAVEEIKRNGIWIPEEMTNGDVLISLYPDLKYVIRNGRVVTTIGVASSFDLGWWNAPYKAEKGES